MFIVYYVSVTTVGGIATDWANDGVFGDGWYLFGIGRSAYEEVNEEYSGASEVVNAFVEDAGDEELAGLLDNEAEEFDSAAAVCSTGQICSNC